MIAGFASSLTVIRNEVSEQVLIYVHNNLWNTGMKNFISKRSASTVLMILLSLLSLFHVLVMAGIIPYSIIWGGRFADRREMLKLECAAVIISLLMLLVVAIKRRSLRGGTSSNVTDLALWLMFAFFLLNTFGNLFAENRLETLLFTPITFLLAIFTFRLAVPDRSKARG
jgi:hypothetical protein